MQVLGLDIGTTTVSAVVMENGKVLAAKTLKNDSFLPGRPAWEKVQDPAVIRATAMGAVEELLEEYPLVEKIGVTGQMHGILYLDSRGEAVSPLYIWQDGRGDLPYDESCSYAAHLSEETGYPLATGFGLVTHYYNLKNGLVPENAAIFCTIHDYMAMLLACRTSPVTEAGDAASFGIFDLENKCFDKAALEKVGIDIALLPPLADNPCIGHTSKGIPVYVAIGDNQASFLGATGGQTNCMLVNVGTGSQFSVHVPGYVSCKGLETRPFPTEGYLLVGSSLCGGRAFALLENFFRQTAKMFEVDCHSAYDAMFSCLKENPAPISPVVVEPLFQGTRQDPALRGSIRNLDVHNFTPEALILGMMQGMTDELYAMYQCFTLSGGKCETMFGSGNGLRKNSYLRECFENRFGFPLVMSSNEEEAACGAALYAAMCH